MKAKLMLTLLAVMLVVSACGKKEETPAAEGTKQESQAGQEVTLKVATLIPPMTDVLDIVKPLLKEDGVNLEVVVLSDNVQPNTALANKEVDANFSSTFLIWSSITKRTTLISFLCSLSIMLSMEVTPKHTSP